MPRSTKSQSEAKLQAALNNMRDSFSFEEFKSWNSSAIVKMYQIGGAFPTVLKNMGAIETKYGMVKLLPKMQTLRASTVRKHMNGYVNESHKNTKVKALKKQPELPFKAEASNPGLPKVTVIAWERRVREMEEYLLEAGKILQELLAGLSK